MGRGCSDGRMGTKALKRGIPVVTKTSTGAGWQRAIVTLTGTVVGVVVIVTLYWAQSVFIPVALAAFLTFLLSPLVTWFRQRGLPRTPAVILVVLCAATALGGVGWLVTEPDQQPAPGAAQVPEQHPGQGPDVQAGHGELERDPEDRLGHQPGARQGAGSQRRERRKGAAADAAKEVVVAETTGRRA